MLASLDLPPGVYRNGADYQSRGRFFDCNLVRWFENTLRPIGGWASHSDSLVAGAARAILTWVDNHAHGWIAIGTHSGLYAMDRAGARFDLTPAGLTVGLADASTLGGYGRGGYDDDAYGAPRPGSDAGRDATVWTLDTFGQDLVGLNAEDGRLYRWSLDTAARAVRVAPTGLQAAPQGNRAVLVTEEGMVMLLGAGGNPRLVQWSDMLDADTWAPTNANMARFQPLQTGGRLMCGRKTPGGIVIFTDQDAFFCTYVGLPDIYNFQRIGTGCGIVSQAAAVATGTGMVAWMGAQGFWLYNGYAQALPSEVGDHVFSDFNRGQKSKVFARHNAAYGEIEWHYPSANSVEIDRHVRWNYRENHWAIGALTRLCAAEAGAFPNPLMIDQAGRVWAHETRFDYGGLIPFAETGPFEMGSDGGGDRGERCLRVKAIYPDERAQGQVDIRFKTRLFPNDIDQEFGPYLLTSPTDVLFEARQVRMRFEGAALADWRVGSFRAEVTSMGRR